MNDYGEELLKEELRTEILEEFVDRQCRVTVKVYSSLIEVLKTEMVGDPEIIANSANHLIGPVMRLLTERHNAFNSEDFV